MRLYEYKIPSKRFGVRHGLILNIGDGFGEIAPLPGWSKETFDEACSETLAFLFSKAPPKSPSVRFGIECASVPFSTKPLKIPLSSLNKPQDGCQTLKLKIGPMKPVDAIEYVKPYLGKYRLRLDCNQMWTLDEALLFAHAFHKNDFEYLEEPVKTHDLPLFIKETDFPVSVDESFREDPDFCLKIPNLKAIIVKPTLSGKLPNFPVILSSSYESSLGILQIARKADCSVAHGLDTFEDHETSILSPPLKAENGYLTWQGSNHPIDFTKLCIIATVP